MKLFWRKLHTDISISPVRILFSPTLIAVKTKNFSERSGGNDYFFIFLLAWNRVRILFPLELFFCLWKIFGRQTKYIYIFFYFPPFLRLTSQRSYLERGQFLLLCAISLFIVFLEKTFFFNIYFRLTTLRNPINRNKNRIKYCHLTFIKNLSILIIFLPKNCSKMYSNTIPKRYCNNNQRFLLPHTLLSFTKQYIFANKIIIIIKASLHH